MLRDYQQQAVDNTIAWVQYKAPHPAIVVMPTGSGKSHVIKALAEHFAALGKRVLILAHRKELLEQTGSKIEAADIGYYSASIGEKDDTQAVTLANIQSLVRRKEGDPFDLILCDECHYIPNNKALGSYWKVIGETPLIGFTATPYRLEGGALGWGEKIYNISYEALMNAGHLTRLSNKLFENCQPDLKKVKTIAGEYNEGDLAEEMMRDDLVRETISAMQSYEYLFNSALVFTVTVDHALLIASKLENAQAIHGGTPMAQRDEMLAAFKRGEIKYLVNCMVLTVGFDAPNIDAIFCLRPTKSKALWEQMCGRGVRTHPGKKKCLLFDMAGNLREHGGIGSPYFGGSREEKEKNDNKICPECEEYIEPKTARECVACGYQWPDPPPIEFKHEAKPNTESSAVFKALETYDVHDVTYKKHLSKTSGKESLMVQYHCDYGKYGNISEWLNPFHQSEWAVKKCQKFFEDRGGSIEHLLYWDEVLHAAASLKKPTAITVDFSEKFPRIKQYHWKTGKHVDVEALDGDYIPF